MPQEPHALDSLLPIAPAGAGWLGVFGVAMVVAMVVVHVAFALGVMAHAGRRQTLFVPSWVWALATLLTGVLGAVGYWVVHVSTLSPLAKVDAVR